MGFPSPANDFAESTLSMNTICGMDANKRIVETEDGYAVIDVCRRPRLGDIVLIGFDGAMEFAKLMGRSFITADGEAIEGEALDDVTVAGVVTHTIVDLMRDEAVV